MKKVYTTQETLELDLGRRSGHGRDGVDLGGQRHDTSGVHNVAEVFNLGDGKNALLAVDAQAGGVETAENFSKITKVLVQRMAGHQNAIEVHEDAIEVPENTVHKALKSLGGILKTKRIRRAQTG